MKLFSTKPTVRMSGGSWWAVSDTPVPGIGQNPVSGMVFRYYLKEKADTNLLKLGILDASGKLVRSYTNQRDESFKSYPGGPPAPQVLWLLSFWYYGWYWCRWYCCCCYGYYRWYCYCCQS